ncbi:MAG: hypothetical protein IJ730_02030 [Alphaproteobacteria bacterium]|nr:hypothetical protein [Alphaproteobacteria bacterium]
MYGRCKRFEFCYNDITLTQAARQEVVDNETARQQAENRLAAIQADEKSTVAEIAALAANTDNLVNVKQAAAQAVADLQQENVALQQKVASLRRVDSLYDLINLPDRDSNVTLRRRARREVVNLLQQVVDLQQKVDITADEKNTTADIATLHTDKV